MIVDLGILGYCRGALHDPDSLIKVTGGHQSNPTQPEPGTPLTHSGFPGLTIQSKPPPIHRRV